MEIYIPLFIVLVALSALFTSAETAFLSLQGVRLQHYVRQEVPGAARVAALLQSPQRLLSATLIGQNLVNTGTATVGAAITAEIVGGGAGVVVATLTVSLILIVFGEVGPKNIALHHNFILARLYALPLRHWSAAVKPAVAALDWTNQALLFLVGGRGEAAAAVSLGELRTAIALGREAGVLEAGESSMLLGALTLQQRQVRSVMIPRVAMVTAEADTPVQTLSERLTAAGYLRLPIYAGSPDNVVGYVHVSAVAAALAAGRGDQRAREIMREVPFESERASLARVLERMQASGSHLVVLIDEYGATAGLVTVEDIVEEVVGELCSESGGERAGLAVQVAGRLFVEGRRSLGDLSDQLGADLSHSEAESVGGLMLAYLRHFPSRGEVVEHRGYRFTVMASEARRVTLVAVEPLPGGEPAGDGGPTGTARGAGGRQSPVQT